MAEQRRYLLEILEDRYDSRSTIVTSQLTLDKWHDIIGNPTLADAVLDRLFHIAWLYSGLDDFKSDSANEHQ